MVATLEYAGGGRAFRRQAEFVSSRNQIGPLMVFLLDLNRQSRSVIICSSNAISSEDAMIPALFALARVRLRDGSDGDILAQDGTQITDAVASAE